MQLTSQSRTYLIFLIITTIINLICFTIVNGVSGFGFYLLFLLISIPFTILFLYTLNCLTYGTCDTWSWILAILNILSLIAITVLMIINATNKTLLPISIPNT